MGRVDVLERQVRDLSEVELAEFRRWFEEFDAQNWDHQIESDVRAGKLDALADAALREHRDGKTSPI
ncbi:MAG TPA: hypothetical protein VHX16_05560 [Chloroflexota bacterium]|jgi:hypothetical protein|nr:hypothetical protein [Chloroflexota bacterium]